MFTNIKLQMPRFLGICFIISLLPFGLASCEQTEPVDMTEATVKLVTDDDKLRVGPEEGATTTVVFSCDHKWKLTVAEDATWLTFDKYEGQSGKLLTLKVTAAENSGSERVAACQIVSGVTVFDFEIVQNQATLVLKSSDVPDYEKIYIPNIDFTGDPLRSDAPWSFCRSKQSEHFIVFWDKQYGEYGLYGDKMGVENTSPTTCTNSRMRVDIDELLEKAEQYFELNIEKLGFADITGGHSTLDDYKMGICLHYTTTWMAYGSGYDNVIGWLWINPDTCKPIGSTIAHEIGHSFQYQTYCDQIHYNGKPDDQLTGWRYGFGGDGGNAYWEQTAQWQSYQSYTNEAFETVNFTEFVNNSHRHFHHEHQRYASYFLHWYMVEKRGLEVIGELWRESYSPYDAIETYQQKYNLTMDELNKELYMYAAKCVTWDFDVEGENMHTGQKGTVRDFGKNYIGKIGWSHGNDYVDGGYTEGWYYVSPERAPEATGFNHIRLNVPEECTVVKASFKGLEALKASLAGWNIGFVALLESGERVYTEDVRVTGLTEEEISYTIPAGCQDLWMVIAATPEEYMQHAWDEDNTNDVVWNYCVKFEGTDLYGTVTFDGTETPHNVKIEKNIELSCRSGYAGPSVTLSGADLIEIAKAFVLQPSEIISKLAPRQGNGTPGKGDIKFLSQEPNGSLYDGAYTANGLGYWYGMDGSVKSWSAASVYTEYAPETWTFNLGCHPDKVSAGSLKAGDVITIKPVLVYGDYRAVIQFNITMVD